MNGSHAMRTSHPHAWEREQLKIIFQYSLMLFASLVLGWILPRFFSQTLWQEAYQALLHHISPTDSPGDMPTLLKTAWMFSKPMLLCIGAVFVFSFSSLSCLITDGLLVYLGARTGCALSLLYAMLRTANDAALASPAILPFLFVLFRVALAAMFLIFSVYMAKHSYRLRIYSREGRPLFHPKTLLTLIVHTALCATICFLLHFLYAYSICLVSK